MRRSKNQWDGDGRVFGGAGCGPCRRLDALRGYRGLRTLLIFRQSVGMRWGRWDCGRGGEFWRGRRRICEDFVSMMKEYLTCEMDVEEL